MKCTKLSGKCWSVTAHNSVHAALNAKHWTQPWSCWAQLTAWGSVFVVGLLWMPLCVLKCWGALTAKVTIVVMRWMSAGKVHLEPFAAFYSAPTCAQISGFLVNVKLVSRLMRFSLPVCLCNLLEPRKTIISWTKSTNLIDPVHIQKCIIVVVYPAIFCHKASLLSVYMDCSCSF